MVAENGGDFNTLDDEMCVNAIALSTAVALGVVNVKSSGGSLAWCDMPVHTTLATQLLPGIKLWLTNEELCRTNDPKIIAYRGS